MPVSHQEGNLKSEGAKARGRQARYDVECICLAESQPHQFRSIPVNGGRRFLRALYPRRLQPLLDLHPVSTLTSHLLIRPYDNPQCPSRKTPTSSCSSTLLLFPPRSEAPYTVTCMYAVSSLLAPHSTMDCVLTCMDGKLETDTMGAP